MEKNTQALHQFVQGMRTDFDNHAESDKSYQNGLNGRIFSENGIFSYSSIKGTIEIYNNPSIIKYLGYCAFNDELLLIVKLNPTRTETVNRLTTNDFSISIPYPEPKVSFTNQINLNTTVESVEIPILEENEEIIKFDDNFSSTVDPDETIDYSLFYETYSGIFDIAICSIDSSETSFPNNEKYLDAFISLTLDASGNIIDNLLWKGFLNLSFTSKTIAFGVEESPYYKRVYFTDYVNQFRSINLKDSNIYSRKSEEFSVFQGTVLLQPLIDSINENGQLKASTVFYTYRLITENGQITEFSPFSDDVKITIGSESDFKGGDISEPTNKSVTIKCYVSDFKNFSEIEAIAIEYEAQDAPTKIVSLGIKSVQEVNEFIHYGNESEFDDSFTLTNILERKNTWKYCSDISSKNNRLIVSGLRNDPIPDELTNLEKYFALKSWDENGETFDTLMNPKPSQYRYIKPDITESLFIIKQKVYNSIKVFGNFTISFVNSDTGEFISNSFSSGTLSYEDYLDQIYLWLEPLKDQGPFLTMFPNLKIEKIGAQVLFSPIDSSIDTEMNNYNFEFNTTQVVQDFDEDLTIKNINIGALNNQIIYGGLSLGFNSGTGVRVTFTKTNERVLKKAITTVNFDDELMHLQTPNLQKDFFKGDFYRLAINLFDKDGFQLFSVPLGDIKIPEIGEQVRYIDENGQAQIESSFYQNSYVDSDGYLNAEKILMKVEVRISCELKKSISMFQIAHVERTEDNRTILCQGLAAPLEKVDIYHRSKRITIKEEVENKWNLPYFGGPTYDYNGLQKFDTDPYGDDYWTSDKRVTTHRAMFYLDSPELIYGRVSDQKVQNGFVQRVSQLNTDHTAHRQTTGEVYPKFSRKIFQEDINGEIDQTPYFVNLSVFSETRINRSYFNEIPVYRHQSFERGEIISGAALDVPQDISNNAMILGRQPWYYQLNSRDETKCNFNANFAKNELFGANNMSPGYRTLIIRTQENVFTDEFIDQTPIQVDTEITGPDLTTYDTHALINIKVNNEDSIFGGKSELAYSRNTFTPLSKTIPVLQESDAIQSFIVEGDSYTSLYTRVKNDYNEIVNYIPALRRDINYDGCSTSIDEYTKYGAWIYAAVIQSSVEPRLAHGDRIYRENKPFNFSQVVNETINNAYFQDNNIRAFISKPFRFKDNPDLGNIVAISEVKLNGDYFDSYTDFLSNNFYELEKNQGDCLNLARHKNEIYAIQGQQTSILYINKETMLNPNNGEEIVISKGTGNVISNHEVISEYGTYLRRNKIENEFGFSFIDENRKEFVKINDPLLLKNSISLDFRKKFESDPIISVEGYYDEHFRENNFIIKTLNKAVYCISYNEAFQLFNGWLELDSDVFMNWNGRVFAPKIISEEDSNSLHELNKGQYLNIFDDQKTIKIGVVCNISPLSTKIFKHWAGIVNTTYNAKQISILTSNNQSRIIAGNHHRYRIREGRHSVPLKNRYDIDDLRGEWMYIEVEFESIDNKKVDIFSFINFVRNSYQ